MTSEVLGKRLTYLFEKVSRLEALGGETSQTVSKKIVFFTKNFTIMLFYIVIRMNLHYSGL